MIKKIFLFSLYLSLLFLAGCSDEEMSKEDQIRQLIASAVLAVENRDHVELAELVGNDYADVKGLNKLKLINHVRAYFFTHKKIHLFTKIDEVTIQNENRAIVKMYVAMAGSVIADASALSSLRADIYLFDFEFVLTDKWFINKAKWKKSSFKDMIKIKHA